MVLQANGQRQLAGSLRISRVAQRTGQLTLVVHQLCVRSATRYTFLMPTRNAIIRVMLLSLASILASGCAAPSSTIDAPLPVAAADYRQSFEAAIASLRGHGFFIDRQDYRFGRITTQPRISPNMVEFWNRDNTTSAQSISASLNNEHRIATIKLDRAPATANDGQPHSTAYELSVEVAIERTTDPNRRLTGSTSAYNIVRPLSETPAHFEEQGVYGQAMVFVERDEHFEQRLLADINQRLNAIAPVEEPVQP